MHRIDVSLDFGLGADGRPLAPRPLGTLAQDGATPAFEFAATFLDAPLPVSPFHVSPRIGLFRHRDRDFDNLPGLFADALPDGFGRLIQDRQFEAGGTPRGRVTPLQRLAALGHSAMGALTFLPTVDGRDDDDSTTLDLDALASQGERLLEGSAEDLLPHLAQAGRSPGGARPKIVAGVHADGRLIAGDASSMVRGIELAMPTDFEPYLIKFAAREDVMQFGPDVGAVEFAYRHMARTAGIDMPHALLFGEAPGARWFGVQRFDRHGSGARGRLHMHTLGGLLHASHRVPSLDYAQLFETTLRLTRDMTALEQVLRRMAFNVFAHNRDDHAKNFAFLMDASGEWRLSPAYDLTYSTGPGGEHTTSVGGEGRAPTIAAMTRIAGAAGLDMRKAARVIDQVRDAVATWSQVAKELEIADATVRRLEQVFSALASDTARLRLQ